MILHSPRHAAFTLLEISMVILVVALLATGILFGQSMQENANLQSVVADVERYRQAALTYKTKYGELPGDHTAASSITSESSALCTLAGHGNNFGTSTCNGNGDGVVGDSTGDPLDTCARYHESLLFWQHLMNENLVGGSRYNGSQTTASNGITFGINVPLTKIAGASFIARNFPTNTVTTGYFKASYGHVFFFGAADLTIDLPFKGAALTTEQAKAIDIKIDDGKPGLGKVLTALDTVSTPCTTTDVETTSAYDTSITTPACALIFITGF